MTPALVALALLACVSVAIIPLRQSSWIWILAMETSPDSWLDRLVGGHETIVAAMKGFGLVLVLLGALRHGTRWDRFNPGFAFLAMFLVGLLHGLYPGLGVTGSLRSLFGSAGPFLFSFVKLPPDVIHAIRRATVWGPLFTVGFGAVLALAGLDTMYGFEQGALRLGASGEAPFLAGFALIAVYAGLLDLLHRPTNRDFLLLAINLLISLLTGARAPLTLAVLTTLIVLLAQRRLLILAALGACAALAVIFSPFLSFMRVLNLIQLGEAGDLSNRNLVWPYFQKAFAESPFLGWGVGAAKVVIPITSHLSALIGTNAAHDEYLRIATEGGVLGEGLLIILMILWLEDGAKTLVGAERWLMRLVFLAFAIHSLTDNTLIATTSSIFFMWTSAVFLSHSKQALQPEEARHDHDVGAQHAAGDLLTR